MKMTINQLRRRARAELIMKTRVYNKKGNEA